MQTSNQTYGAGESYDILHKNKDYEKEVDYIQECFDKYADNVNTVLDIGCGTGGHSAILHKRGIKQLGIDPCATMIGLAKNKPGTYKCASLKELKPSVGDYDAAISMFHVVNHITTLDNLFKYFQATFSQLRTGGVLIFDCFNSIAFNRDAPKTLQKESYTITPVVDYFKAQMDLIGQTKSDPMLDYNIRQRIWSIDVLLEVIHNSGFTQNNTIILKQNTHTLATPDDYKLTIICRK
jgi:2-polyprenyl-3-methyl-5-hydroxy-6-metoxy-1,4-benzoquinol methylase|tara:strand:+ start:639 stop:1349 length:711 start_codon:yes stop_codon:yes gene_type:complete